MKKSLVICLMMIGILVGIFLSSGSTAFAWHGSHFGVFIAPPPLLVGPPAPYYRGYYPPYYGPGYYSGPARTWMPGHWESRWSAYGWQRVWVAGYWRYY